LNTTTENYGEKMDNLKLKLTNDTEILEKLRVDLKLAKRFLNPFDKKKKVFEFESLIGVHSGIVQKDKENIAKLRDGIE